MSDRRIHDQTHLLIGKSISSKCDTKCTVIGKSWATGSINQVTAEAVTFCPANYKRGPSTLHSSLLKLKTPLTHIEVYIYVCIPISNSGIHTSYESPSDFRVRDCQRLACMHAFQVFWEKMLFMTCVDMFCMSQIDN